MWQSVKTTISSYIPIWGSASVSQSHVSSPRQLPLEIWHEIFKYVSTQNMSSLYRVNRDFHALGIKVVQERVSLQAQQWIMHLSTHIGQKQRMETVMENYLGSQHPNLTEMKKQSIQFRNDIFEILVDLEQQDLNKLINSSGSGTSFFPTAGFCLSELVSRRRELRALQAVSNEDWRKPGDLVVLAEKCIEAKDIYQALEIAGILPKGERKEHLLLNVVVGFREANDLLQALEIAQTMSKGEARERAFAQVCEGFIETKDMTRALKVAQALCVGEYQEQAFYSLVEGFLEAKDMKQARKVAHTMPLGIRRTGAFNRLFDAYMENKDFESAHEIAQTALEGRNQQRALQEVVEKWIEARNKEKALEIAIAMQAGVTKQKLLKKIQEI